MDKIEKPCTHCGTNNFIEATSGLGGVATWKTTCDQCGSEAEGYRTQAECKAGEAFTDVTIFD